MILPKNKPHKPKICLVCSSGGHLYKTYRLKPWWSNYQRIWITRKDIVSKDLLKLEPVFFGYFPDNRNLFNLLRNFLLAIKIIFNEKPDLIFSLGAGISTPFMVVGKLFGIKTVFMETFILINHPTLSGKINYHFADIFLVQNKKLLSYYPNAKYLGSIL
jgi:UDP-N-acetylglucosamine:LPS N-acetylglucosamine transferase